MDKNFDWLEIARELQSLSQTGLAFCENDYDIDRYNKIMKISSRIVAEHADYSQGKVEEIFFNQPGYATPKVDVRAATIKDGKILLVKELADGRWSMPGGWADVGDKPGEVAKRETFEESGYNVEPVKVVGVFDANRSGRPLELFHAFKIIFLCNFIGGEAKISNETSDVGFFDFSDLPPLSSNRTNERHLAEIQEHLRNEARATHFD